MSFTWSFPNPLNGFQNDVDWLELSTNQIHAPSICQPALILHHMSLNIDSIVSILPNRIEPRLIHLFQFILWFPRKPSTLNRCLYKERMRFNS